MEIKRMTNRKTNRAGNPFKAGDRVVLDMNCDTNTNCAANRTYVSHLVGRTLTVARISHSHIYIEGDTSGPYLYERFKIAPTIMVETTPASEFVIMLCAENGNFAPSEKPKVFSSKSQAKAVAISMAKKYGGRFVVFQAVADAEVTKPRVRDFA
jgi:hypothetical protein